MKKTSATTQFETIAADIQDKAAAAFAKGTTQVEELTAFAKGNVEAAVESGKVLAGGLKELTVSNFAEGRSALETLTADLKGFAAVKSPTDFFQLQSEVLRRQFDSAIALGSKNTEAVMKVANAAFAPISGRINVAVEAVKKAA